MSRSFDSLIPIRRILKKVGDVYSRMTFRPALSFEGSGVTVTDDPTYVDEFGNTVGKTIVDITAAGGTAGDGIDVTLGVVSVDLTDTTKFTDSGVASRAVVLDASSRVVANGLRRTSGNVTVETVTSGTLSVASAGALDLDSVGDMTISANNVRTLTLEAAGDALLSLDGGAFLVDGDGGISALEGGGTLGVNLQGGSGGAYLTASARTTDALPIPLRIRAGNAYGTATGANKIGAPLRLGGGRGDDPGTDLGGDVVLSHGRHVADNSTAEIAGYYGDATDDDFENKLWALKRDASARCLFASTPTMLVTTGAQFVVAAATEVQIEAGGSAYGSLYLGSGLWQQYMPGGHEVVLGPSAANRGGRKCPARVTPGSSGATPVGSYTVPANAAGRFRGTLTARNGAGNAKSWDVSIEHDADGTTATIQAAGRVFTVLPGNVGTISTVAGDLTTSVAGLVVSVTAANGTGYVFSLTGWLEV